MCAKSQGVKLILVHGIYLFFIAIGLGHNRLEFTSIVLLVMASPRTYIIIRKNHCNDNCNDFSDYNGIIAPLDKLIMSYMKLIITLPSGLQ